MNSEITIRTATVEDAKDILDIYAFYVVNTAITFEYEIPDTQEFGKRIADTLKKYPYLVAIQDGKIVGYAYASPLKNRSAYDWSVETTIYLHPEQKKNGLGKKLYVALEDRLKKQNIINLYACIAYISEEEQEEHLDNASVYFHEHLGYKRVAHFTKCGYKFHTWYDVVWMEKIIGEHSIEPKLVAANCECSIGKVRGNI